MTYQIEWGFLQLPFFDKECLSNLPIDFIGYDDYMIMIDD